jgi:4-amino-4-deoxy-L-arabinose transferase-like glycosyltransferase
MRLGSAAYYLNFDKHALAIEGIKPFFFGSYSTMQVIGNRDYYNSMAHRIAFEGKIGPSKLGKPAVPPPLYPIFLAIFYRLFGFNVYSFLIPQISIAAISSMLIFFLSDGLFDNKKMALIAGLFYALNPHFIIFAIKLNSETLYLFLLLSMFLYFKKLLLKPNLKNIVVAGVLLGLAALCRTVFLIFIPFIFAWLFHSFFDKKKELLITLFYLFLSFSLIYGPWVVRNHKIFKRILFSVDYYVVWEPVNSPPEYKEILSNLKAKGEFSGSAFIRWIGKNPGQYFKLCKERLVIFLFSGHTKNFSLRNRIISIPIFYTVFPLGYLGIIVAVIKKNRLATLIFLYILSTAILHILTNVDGEGLRYRLPIELLLGIFACYGIEIIVSLREKLRIPLSIKTLFNSPTGL